MASTATSRLVWTPSRPVGRLPAHHVGDGGPDVAALGDVAGVAEAAHQLRPGDSDVARVPADLPRLCREAVAGQRRQHEVERVLGVAAVRGRVGERADGLEELDDRAGPAVRHDQRQRVLVRRLHVDEVDVHAVDLGHELRQRVQSRLARAPVVLASPSSGRAPASSPVARPATGRRRAPWRASASLRCGGAAQRAAPPEPRFGTGGSLLLQT